MATAMQHTEDDQNHVDNAINAHLKAVPYYPASRLILF